MWQYYVGTHLPHGDTPERWSRGVVCVPEKSRLRAVHPLSTGADVRRAPREPCATALVFSPYTPYLLNVAESACEGGVCQGWCSTRLPLKTGPSWWSRRVVCVLWGTRSLSMVKKRYPPPVVQLGTKKCRKRVPKWYRTWVGVGQPTHSLVSFKSEC